MLTSFGVQLASLWLLASISCVSCYVGCSFNSHVVTSFHDISLSTSTAISQDLQHQQHQHYHEHTHHHFPPHSTTATSWIFSSALPYTTLRNSRTRPSLSVVLRSSLSQLLTSQRSSYWIHSSPSSPTAPRRGASSSSSLLHSSSCSTSSSLTDTSSGDVAPKTKLVQKSDEGGTNFNMSLEMPVTLNMPPETRPGYSTDGTALTYLKPTTQDLYTAGMSMLDVGSVAIAARISFTSSSSSTTADDVSVASNNAVVALALISPIMEEGSSVATCAFNLRVWNQEQMPTAGAGEADMTAVRHAVTHECINLLLCNGARIHQLRALAYNSKEVAFFNAHGLVVRGLTKTNEGVIVTLMSGDRTAALAAITKDLESFIGSVPTDTVKALAYRAAKCTLLNIKARLLHDLGFLEQAVEAYMEAVKNDPTRASVFTCLGGVYQSLKQLNFAFASYQQAINLDCTDYVAYLKLGMLYEELAGGKYEEAAERAVQCFNYYLTTSGIEDTDVLTRLGNLYIKRLEPEEAIKAYERALKSNDKLVNVWFNLANAHLKLQDKEAAIKCLNKTLKLDPGMLAAKYMLASLKGDANALSKEEQRRHVKELFEFFAETYDDYMRKKLLYTGPRILRQTIRDIYNETYVTLSPEDQKTSFTVTRRRHHQQQQQLRQQTALDAEKGAVVTYETSTVLTWLNKSLDILDLGCGTGLVGSWVSDYAHSCAGVDLSVKMIDMAEKKGCYTALKVADMEDYIHDLTELMRKQRLQQQQRAAAASANNYGVEVEVGEGDEKDVIGYDVVFAADSLQYVGALDKIVKGVAEVLRPGGYFAFTVEKTDDSTDGFLLQDEGTFAYSEKYLRGLAEQGGLEVVVLKPHSTRIERGEPLPGFLGVMRKR